MLDVFGESSNCRSSKEEVANLAIHNFESKLVFTKFYLLLMWWIYFLIIYIGAGLERRISNLGVMT